jgi:hypothetical protein
MSDALPAILGILVVAVVAGFALLPLLQGAPPPTVATIADPAETERFRIYRQVLELEFDFQTGKLAAEDYTSLSRELLGQATQLMRVEAPVDQDVDVDAEVEREIAAARRAFASARGQRQGAKIPS